MKLTSIQIVLYLIFIICILGISYYYTSIESNDTITNNTTSIKNSPNTKIKENFGDTTTDVNNALKLEINTELDKLNVKDVITQNKIFTHITSLLTLLNKYKYIDAPITINNNGKLCDNWGPFNKAEYASSLNKCIITSLPGQHDRICLSNNNLVSCSKYYYDGKIDSLNTIDVNEILNNAKYNIYLGISDINNDIYNANIDMTTVLTDYIGKRNLENQQKYFIKYNEYNLEDKKKIINKNNKEFEKTENDVNINKIQFQQTVEQNNYNEAKKTKYYNYIFYTVILIIIVGILNFMFSSLE
jgi:hypothetical protein